MVDPDYPQAPTRDVRRLAEEWKLENVDVWYLTCATMAVASLQGKRLETDRTLY